MPQLDDLLAKALQKEPKKTFTRGNRPDRIASGYLPQSLDSGKSGAKVEPEPEPQVEPKWSQSEVKVESFQISKNGSGAKVEPEPEPQVEPKWSQSEVKVETKVEPMPHSSLVVGLQRKALVFLYESCRFSGSKTSLPFAIQNIAAACGTSVSATKKALQRLEQKQILYRTEYKDGRSGWTRYQLPDSIYGAMLHDESRAKLESNWSQCGVKVGTKVEPEPEPSAPSSSSSLRSIDLKTTTTEETNSAELRELNAPWQSIDCSPLAEFRLGRGQIAQIAQSGRVTSEELQDSIYAFAFDLSENQKAKNISGAPLNYFMGILRKGPYTPPANYEDPQSRQRRLYLEAKEEQRKKRLELEERLEAVEFEEWLEKQTIEQRTLLVPPKDFAKPGGTVHSYQLREYFRENIWPNLRLMEGK